MDQNIRLLNILHLLYYRMKRVTIYLVISCLLICCKKDEDSSFVISLQQTTPTTLIEFEDNISVKLDYEHPEGYVGFFDPDYLSLEIKDSRLPNADYYHLIPVDPPNHTLSVTGEILIEIDAPFVFGNGNSETLTFTIRIEDKNKNWSNKVTTPIITVNK